MLIFLRGQTAVDVNILLPSMLIFSLLVTGPVKGPSKKIGGQKEFGFSLTGPVPPPQKS
jgi:hypothetical protein